jgi:Uma2 family endonuclease
MYALISREKTQLPPGTVVRMPGTWQDYCALRDSRGGSSIPRIKYRNGEILLMSPLPKHGCEAHLLARLVEILLDSQNRNYEAFTPITMELPEEGGIEPDYCFYINQEPEPRFVPCVNSSWSKFILKKLTSLRLMSFLLPRNFNSLDI